MNIYVLAAGLAIGVLGFWFLLFGAAMLITRPARPEPAPATQELPGPESPAVVSLLAGYWDLSEDAPESTLVDLAARHYLEFRQPGNDPVQTTVHVTGKNPSGLNPYERKIYERVAGLAVGGVVPLTALTFRDQKQAAAFEKRLRTDVIAEARTRGLSRRRLGPTARAVLSGAAIAAGFGLALAVLLGTRHSGDSVKGAGAAWLFGTVVLAGIANANVGERDTEAGRAVAARWLGVKAWLRNTEAFADLPPAAVAVWDRYLSYGTALGTTRVTSAVIDLGMGNRKRVWSSWGGTWHRVRIRYPRFWPRYGKKAGGLIARGVVASVVGVVLLYYWARGVAAALKEPAIGESAAARYADAVQSVGLLLGGLLLAYGLYVLVRVTIDLASPVSVTGQVLWRQVWRQTSQGENSPPRPWLHYLAIDDGGDDRTTAWGLPSEHAGRCTDGDTVTIQARRWTRRVIELTVVEHGTMRRVEIADPDEQNTEALIAVAMGTAPSARPTGPAVGTAALLTADEVGRAVGAPVTVRGGLTPGPLPLGAAQFHTPDGQLAVLLAVIGGLPGQLAMRARRQGQPLPGIGEEAYAGEGWAMARRGDQVIALTVRRPVDPRAVHWLLATAASRLGAPVPGAMS
jgi:Predicted membrane protein (DUF2207)